MLSFLVGGAQIGSQGGTQRIGLQGEIWLHLSPTFGVAAGGKYLRLSRWGGSCRNCFLSTSYLTHRNSCFAPHLMNPDSKRVLILFRAVFLDIPVAVAIVL